MSAVVVQVQNKEDKWVVGEKLFLLFCGENNILQTNLVWCLTYCPIFVLSLWRTLYEIRFQLPFIFLRMSGNNRRKDACVFFWKCHFSVYCLLRQWVCDIRCHLYLYLFVVLKIPLFLVVFFCLRQWAGDIRCHLSKSRSMLRFKYTFSVVKETWTIKEVTVWKRKTAAKLYSSSGWRVLKEGKYEGIRCAWFELLTLSQKLEPTNFLPLCCKGEIFLSMDKWETDEYWYLLSCFVSQKSKDLHLLKTLEPRYMQIIKTTPLQFKK